MPGEEENIGGHSEPCYVYPSCSAPAFRATVAQRFREPAWDCWRSSRSKVTVTDIEQRTQVDSVSPPGARTAFSLRSLWCQPQHQRGQECSHLLSAIRGPAVQRKLRVVLQGVWLTLYCCVTLSWIAWKFSRKGRPVNTVLPGLSYVCLFPALHTPRKLQKICAE
ncbi:fibroblast growth factor 1 isoform X1 [Marmota marmota marmota]|uniref:fibroblast growth factor 1 isoform X1 n=1 Tax=Marmota marmota marmota TaxID=9994 RepID=UPI002093B2CD|nr:fibroblast growth factor 1 isoform X1 [Marmota marmota marmota]